MDLKWWAVTKTWYLLARDEEEAKELADEGDLVDVQAEPLPTPVSEEDEEDMYHGV